MECHDARLLLTIQRREPEQLDTAELEAVERHIELCPGCQTWNQSEARFETAVVSAFANVQPPTGLKQRLTAKLLQSRPRSRAPWVAAAAVVLLAIGGTGAFVWMRPEPIDLNVYVVQPDDEGYALQAVQNYFADLGYSMTPPPNFQYDYLVAYKLARFQGRMVPRLTFQNRQPNGSLVTAYVYCLPSRQFRYTDPDPHFLQTDHRNLFVEEGASDLYVIDCTGGSIWLLRQRTF